MNKNRGSKRYIKCLCDKTHNDICVCEARKGTIKIMQMLETTELATLRNTVMITKFDYIIN